jgi:hypothetical protein
MRRRVAHWLVVVLSLTLGLAGPARAGDSDGGSDPCGPGSGVSIFDFVMWDSGGGFAEIPVRTRFPCVESRVITFTTFDLSAKAGEDYAGVDRGTVTLDAGTTETIVRIEIFGRFQSEPSKSFGVRLLEGARFDDPVGIVTIESY